MNIRPPEPSNLLTRLLTREEHMRLQQEPCPASVQYGKLENEEREKGFEPSTSTLARQPSPPRRGWKTRAKRNPKREYTDQSPDRRGAGYFRVLILSLVLAGCGEAPWAWKGTTDFTPEERVQIEEAQAFVCQHTDRECLPIEWSRAPGDRSPYTIVRAEIKGAGYADLAEGLILLYPTVPPMRRVAAHEFGHWTGMQHLPQGTSGLMFAEIGSNVLEWSEADEQECLRVDCRQLH